MGAHLDGEEIADFGEQLDLLRRTRGRRVFLLQAIDPLTTKNWNCCSGSSVIVIGAICARERMKPDEKKSFCSLSCSWASQLQWSRDLRRG
jgi:hypothetical protein